jgi:hypothetical protein
MLDYVCDAPGPGAGSTTPSGLVILRVTVMDVNVVRRLFFAATPRSRREWIAEMIRPKQ